MEQTAKAALADLPGEIVDAQIVALLPEAEGKMVLLLIELVGGKYVALGTESDVAAQVARRLALDVAPTDEGAALQMKELVEAAREHDSHVKKTTFENQVKKHVSFGKLRVIGAGRKNDPYKYYRPP